MVQNLYKLGLINVPIPQEAKFCNTPNLYTTNVTFISSINTGSISISGSSDTRQSHHPLWCHAAGINSSFNYFSSALGFPNLVCLLKKLFWLERKLKEICLAKKLFWLEKKLIQFPRQKGFLNSY